MFIGGGVVGGVNAVVLDAYVFASTGIFVILILLLMMMVMLLLLLLLLLLLR